MTREERIEKLRHLITCMKCEVGGKSCDNNCPTQYYAGNMGEIIENLEEIAKALEQESCEDCISRQAVIDALRDEENHAFNSYYKGLIKAHKIIANLPPVKPVACIAKVNFNKEDMQEIVDKKVKKMVVRKTGHWIYSGSYDVEGMLYCSNCKHEIDVSEGYFNFCPNCGCKMIESEGKE